MPYRRRALCQFLALSLLSLALMSSCGPDIVSRSTLKIQESGWSYPDTLSCAYTVADTQQVHDLLLDIGHSTSYGFQNLYVKIHTYFPSGRHLQQVVSLELADKFGTWQGHCSGETCHIRIPIQEGAYFQETGTYRLTIEQFMRTDPLPGVSSITFLLEKRRASRLNN
jgi:gliding motility-associated lipoprotein GldH